MAKPPKGVQRKGGKKQRKYGRWARKPSNLRYKAGSRMMHNKLKRIRKTQGQAAADKYLLERGW